MTIDLYEKLTKEKVFEKKWEQSEFLKFVTKICTKLDMSFDWDDAVPENWASVNSPDVIAYVCSTIPWVFIKEEHYNSIEEFCRQHDVFFLKVNDFDEKTIVIKEGTLSRYFGDAAEDIEKSAQPVSVNDIWFHTVA